MDNRNEHSTFDSSQQVIIKKLRELCTASVVLSIRVHKSSSWVCALILDVYPLLDFDTKATIRREIDNAFNEGHVRLDDAKTWDLLQGLMCPGINCPEAFDEEHRIIEKLKECIGR